MATSSQSPVAAQQVAHLEREAARVHLEAQALNKAGRFDEARLKYDEMQALERRALELAAAAATCPSCETEAARQGALQGDAQQRAAWPPYSLARSAEDYASVLPAARFRGAAARARAAAAVAGAYAADCASVGVQWIYDTAVLEGLLLERARAAAANNDKRESGGGGDGGGDGVGLEFCEPVASPFLQGDYENGRASPYGEETLVLIRELAAAEARGEKNWGLHCGRYAERYARAFGGGGAAGGAFRGYMNASTRGFLRNFAASGLRPPFSGADDKQADCVARVAPLVAAFGGSGGGDGDDDDDEEDEAPPPSTRRLLPLLLAAEMATRTTQNDGEAVAWACAAALVLRRVVLGDRIEDAARKVVGRLEAWAAAGPEGPEEHEQQQGCEEEACASAPPPPPLPLPMRPALAAEIAARMGDALSRAAAGEKPEQAVAGLGRNCHLPNSYQTPLHAALFGERLFEERQRGGQDEEDDGGGRAQAASAAFVAAIRGALRGGGCCSSRAQTAGALLAARLGEDAIPKSWRERCWDWKEVEEAGKRIAGCC